MASSSQNTLLLVAVLYVLWNALISRQQKAQQAETGPCDACVPCPPTPAPVREACLAIPSLRTLPNTDANTVTVGTTPGATTIQDAVNLITSVGTVLIPAGTYVETITVLNKIITFRPATPSAVVNISATSTAVNTYIFIVNSSTIALVDLNIGMLTDPSGTP